MSELNKARTLVDEARQEYQDRKHNKLTRWDNESDEHFAKRKDVHRKRVQNAEKVVEHLTKKAEALAAEKAHRKEQKKEDKNPYDRNGDHIVSFDSKDCVELAAYWLFESRKAGWTGVLVSGYRTPEYSESLCYNMCGAPSCPGMCAGKSSNHARTTYPGPAVDVSEYTQFESIQYQIHSPLKNTLDYRDPVHFSQAGN